MIQITMTMMMSDGSQVPDEQPEADPAIRGTQSAMISPQVFLRITGPTGHAKEVLLHPGGWQEGAVVEEREFGLRLKLHRAGHCVIGGGDFLCRLAIPVRNLPADWGIERDLSIADMFAEFRRRGRPESWVLESHSNELLDLAAGRRIEIQERPALLLPAGGVRVSEHLDFAGVLDSPQLSELRRRELDIDRAKAAELGRSAVRIAQQGHYVGPEGTRIDLAEMVSKALTARQSLPPDAPLPSPAPTQRRRTRVEVTNETTLGAAHRLSQAGQRLLALNFANGIEPGGGFLSGARAQEECLCRSSALYLTLRGDPMYDFHLQRPEPDSSSWCILSPDVPVFRSDSGAALEVPWSLDFITCAAPVASRIGVERAAGLLRERIGRVLHVAHAHGYESLVLGAWGCGAFGCDPRLTAAAFRDWLESSFAGAFDRVVFAITDWSPERRFLGPFAEAFGHRNAGGW